MTSRTFLFGLLAMFLMPAAVAAGEESKALGEVETNWPGVDYRITFIDRLPSGRLLVGVSIAATASAPPGGTMIGFAVPIPPNAPKIAIMSGAFHPRPLDLTTSVMKEEKTGQTYPALSPVAPPGKEYPPAAVFGGLLPGHSYLMTLQFATPPPPPIPPGATKPPKQTVSIFLANAKKPIAKVPLPDAPSVGGNQP